MKPSLRSTLRILALLSAMYSSPVSARAAPCIDTLELAYPNVQDPKILLTMTGVCHPAFAAHKLSLASSKDPDTRLEISDNAVWQHFVTAIHSERAGLSDAVFTIYDAKFFEDIVRPALKEARRARDDGKKKDAKKTLRQLKRKFEEEYSHEF